jgi:hypothetical protein
MEPRRTVSLVGARTERGREKPSTAAGSQSDVHRQPPQIPVHQREKSCIQIAPEQNLLVEIELKLLACPGTAARRRRHCRCCVGNVSFLVSDASKVLDQARVAVIAGARRKAEICAKAAGVQLEWAE